MDVKTRIDDIAGRTGLSSPIVRRVLDASRESLIETLGKGEKATLPGIATFRPSISAEESLKVYSKPSLRVQTGSQDRYKQEAEKREDNGKVTLSDEEVRNSIQIFSIDSLM